MSTITIVKKNGYAAIAADTLITSGSFKQSAEYVVNHQKIMKYGHSYLATSGPRSVIQSLELYLQGLKSSPQLDSHANISEVWLSFHEALKEKYYLNLDRDDDDPVESLRIATLIINPEGIFSVNSYRSFSELAKFYAYESGSEYAFGAMYAVYNDERYSAEEVARLGVAAGAEFDDATGTPITSYRVKLRAKKR